MQALIDAIAACSPDIRYVAVYANGSLSTYSGQGLAEASSSESDKYEELIVNPTILTLVRQRGNIDCGGAEFVLIRYGNFFQFVTPFLDGHVSVCIQPTEDPLVLAPRIRHQIEQFER